MVHTAHEWGHNRIKTFMDLPEDEQAVMIAYIMTRSKMESYEFEHGRSESNKTLPKGNVDGV